MNFRLTKAE